jgi:hypothetical protein
VIWCSGLLCFFDGSELLSLFAVDGCDGVRRATALLDARADNTKTFIATALVYSVAIRVGAVLGTVTVFLDLSANLVLSRIAVFGFNNAIVNGIVVAV